jgi:hypothetical protein
LIRTSNAAGLPGTACPPLGVTLTSQGIASGVDTEKFTAPDPALLTTITWSCKPGLCALAAKRRNAGDTDNRGGAVVTVKLTPTALPFTKILPAYGPGLSVLGFTLTVSTPGVVPAMGVTDSHVGAGVFGCPPSKVVLNEAAVAPTESTATVCDDGALPPAIALKFSALGESCTGVAPATTDPLAAIVYVTFMDVVPGGAISVN